MRKFLRGLVCLLTFGPTVFAQQPVISSVSSMQAHPGANIIITGTGFNATAANNIVYFGATKAAVGSATTTSVTVNVPVGATYMPVSLSNTASGLTGYSHYPFLPTYDNSLFDATVINFDPKVDFLSGTNAKSVAIGDLNGDGKPDVVVASSGSNDITVYRNTSTAGVIDHTSFATGVTYATSQPAYDVAIADIDGDGKLDIVVTNSGTVLNYVSIFRNTSSGGAFTAASFATRVDLGANASIRGISIADIDLDGKADIAAACQSNVVNVFQNQSTPGGIAFAPKQNFSPGTAPLQIELADLDGDSKPEMVVVNSTSNDISVFRNVMTGPGTIVPGSFAGVVNFLTGTTPRDMTISDIDGDGKLDVSVASTGSFNVSVFRNTSTTGTITMGIRVDFATTTPPYHIASGDMNGDGRPDLIVTNGVGPGTEGLSVLRNASTSGTITASSLVRSDLTMPNGNEGLAIGDLDGDGKPDVSIANDATGMLSILRNNPIAAITGTMTVCVGATTTLNNTTTSGTWTSGHTSIATVGSLTGIVTGLAAGTALISYNVSGVHVTAVVTVLAAPDPGTISGTASVCIGSNTALSTMGTGGVWSSTNTAIGTVDVAGAVSGLSAGTTTISYTVATVGCGTLAATRDVTVNALPAAIMGPDAFCDFTEATYTSSPGGGTWSSSNTAIANFALPSTGIAQGHGTGTATISYTHLGCSATKIVTVILAPYPTTGIANVCVGNTITLTNPVGGATWSSSNTGVATVAPLSTNSVTVTGVAIGTATISYVLSTGCASMIDVTVDAMPVAGTISGATNVCSGSSITLATTGTGGSWSTTFTGIATVDAGTGVVTGASAGTAEITYTVTNACATATATYIVTVNALPDPITGTPNVCVGATTTLNSLTPSGSWSSGNTSIATVGSSSGIVSGVAPGVAIISYTVAGCRATAVVTVDLAPFTGTLSGATAFCVGTDITLTSPAMGGTWVSSDVAVATVGTSGIVSGVGQGTATITYTNTNACGAASTTAVVTVEVTPNPGTISGPSTVCAGGSTITLTNTATTGTWSSSNPLAATVSASGVVTGVDPGTTTISYTVMNSCDTLATTVVVTVNALPDVIVGPSTLCRDATATLSSATSGGSWSSSAPLVVSVDGTGLITGLATGAATISYTLVVGCYRTKSVTVNPLPAAISGLPFVCVGATITLTNANAGGTWVSGNTAVATIGTSSGILTGVAPGTSLITYTRPVTGCTITKVVTVNELPSTIAGDSVLCQGVPDTFSALPAGGSWLSNPTFYASITPSTGILQPLNAGTIRVTYTTAAGCRGYKQVTINQSPSTITGAYSVCEGATSTLSNTVPFGVWSSSNPIVGIINTSGVVAGMSPGTSRVSYTLSNGCFRAITVTINALPTITGPNAVCTGNTIVVTAAPTSGTWSSSNTAVATVAGGTISGVSGGTAAISFTLVSTGCKRAHVVSVNPSPTNISGTPVMCEGASVLLSSTPLTGTWISSNPAVASVGSSAGLVTGVSAGTTIITYELAGTGCRKTVTATVNPLPAPITGTATVCIGLATTFSTSPALGTWSSSNTVVATVGIFNGIIVGASAGTSIITYRTQAGCIATRTVTVNPTISAGAILGPPTVCEAGTVTLTATVTGGTWASSTGKVSVDAAGVVTGVSAGLDTIKYTVTGTCNAPVAKYAMTVNPLPTIGGITGEDSVCVGNSNMLTTSVLGGMWSSSNTGVATVAGGMVTGVATGTAIISYSATNACGSSSATLTVTVIPAIDAGTISGPDTVCYGNTITLSSTTPGGTWSSSSLFITVGSATGNVTGVAPGLATIRYVAFNICSTDTTYYNVYVRYDIDCPTAVGPQVNTAAQIKLYPTPTHGVITVEIPVAGILDVYTIDGKKVGSYNVGKNTSSLMLPNGIAAGIYMCRFSGEDGSSAVMRAVYEP